MKTINKKLLFFNLLLIFSLIMISADGGFIPPNNYNQDIFEPNQNAIIVFNEETEKLILQVSYESEIEEFAWVVPVPTYPKINKSSSLLFNQLSTITKPIHHRAFNPLDVFGRSMMSATLGMEGVNGWKDTSLHDRLWMDVYTIEIVSSTSSSSLYDWLVENDYSVSPKIKDALDPYVEDGWYFVIMKFNSDYRVYELINHIKKMDSTVISVEDAKPVLVDYIIDSIKLNKQYQNTKLGEITYTSIGQNNQGYYYGYNQENNPQVPFITQQKYKEYMGLISNEALLKEKITQDLESTLNWDDNVDSNSKKSGVLNPLQIEFETTEIVYPLKVSSMNSGVSEILLYVLAPYKTEIDNFEEFGLEYAKEVKTNEIKNYKELNSLFDQRYFITKHRAELFPNDMSKDIKFSKAPNDKEFVLHTYEDGYVAGWIISIVVLIFLYIISVAICLFFRWINNLIIKNNKESRMYIPLPRIFLQGIFLPFLIIILVYITAFIFYSPFGVFNNLTPAVSLIMFFWVIIFSFVIGFIATHFISFVISLIFSPIFSLFKKKNKDLGKPTKSTPIQNK